MVLVVWVFFWLGFGGWLLVFFSGGWRGAYLDLIWF